MRWSSMSLLVFASMMPMASMAQGAHHWAMLNADTYILAPQEPSSPSRIILYVTMDRATKAPIVELTNLGGLGLAYCAKYSTHDTTTTEPVIVNATPVRFHARCIVGADFDRPISAEGIAYLAVLLEKEEPVTIQTGFGGDFHYNTAGFKDV